MSIDIQKIFFGDEMIDIAVFSGRLKALRNQAKLTQKQLAEATGTSERGIQNYEGGVRLVDTRTLVKFCVYFDISADYLLGLIDEPKKLQGED